MEKQDRKRIKTIKMYHHPYEHNMICVEYVDESNDCVGGFYHDMDSYFVLTPDKLKQWFERKQQ